MTKRKAFVIRKSLVSSCFERLKADPAQEMAQTHVVMCLLSHHARYSRVTRKHMFEALSDHVPKGSI